MNLPGGKGSWHLRLTTSLSYSSMGFNSLLRDSFCPFLTLFCLCNTISVCGIWSREPCTVQHPIHYSGNGKYIFPAPFHRCNALNIAQQCVSPIYYTRLTAVIHNTFWLHKRLLCLPFTLCFIQFHLNGGKHSYIPCVTPHGHKESLVTDRISPVSFCLGILVTSNPLYQETDFLQNSCRNNAWNAGVHLGNRRLSRHRGLLH
jgi:hypothetical protein